MTLIILSRKIGLIKCAKFMQNSRKWCAEFALCLQNFEFFGAEF